MATRVQKMKVGVFITLCFGLIAGGLLLLSGYQHEDPIPYWIEFEESVLGLSADGLVEYLGVPVGRVENIYVDKNNHAHVEIGVLPSKVTLKQGVTAKLVLYSLATGTLCVSLQGGHGPALPAGAQIQAEPSLVKAVSMKVENLITNLNDITQAVKSSMANMEEGQITGLVERTNELLTESRDFMASARNTLETVGNDAGSGLEDLRSLVKDLRELTTNTNLLVRTAEEKVEGLRIEEGQQQISEALSSLTQVARRLEDTMNTIDTVARTAVHKTDNLEYNLYQTLETVNEALAAIRDLTEYLQEDPSALIRGKGKRTER